jgi:LDH2 family malate/lactate/ureidoglycolate dehydrogenase
LETKAPANFGLLSSRSRLKNTMPSQPIRQNLLRKFAASAYERVGLRHDRAELCADTLVCADLWGHSSHGVMRLPWYVARLRSKACDAAASPELVVDGGAIAVMDGHDAMGQVVTAEAAEQAVRRAKAHGIGAVAVRNSNHFGTALYFTLMAARRDCVAFLSTNASPAMAPWGGRKKLVGTNPWSWACPGGQHAPMALDIANTSVARGKIYYAKQSGARIPDGWAMTAEGVPTTDPAEAIAGLILPVGQHKGYAIAVMMDMLSGVLTGSAFGSRVQGPYQPNHKSGAGHFMIALDIAAFQPVDQFKDRIEKLIRELKSAPLAQDAEEVLYPGELEARSYVRNERDGLILADDTVRDLRALAEELDLKNELPFEQQQETPARNIAQG